MNDFPVSSNTCSQTHVQIKHSLVHLPHPTLVVVVVVNVPYTSQSRD